MAERGRFELPVPLLAGHPISSRTHSTGLWHLSQIKDRLRTQLFHTCSILMPGCFDQTLYTLPLAGFWFYMIPIQITIWKSSTRARISLIHNPLILPIHYEPAEGWVPAWSFDFWDFDNLKRPNESSGVYFGKLRSGQWTASKKANDPTL